MDYSFFTWVDGFSLVVPNPGNERRLFAFVGPFQPWVNLLPNFVISIHIISLCQLIIQVWMSIFISVFFVVVTMTFFNWFYNQQSNSVARIPSRNILTFFGCHMIYVTNTLTNQGLTYNTKFSKIFPNKFSI